jgi:hypothetical protein
MMKHFSPRRKFVATLSASIAVLGVAFWGFGYIASVILRDQATRADLQERLVSLAQDRVRADAAAALRGRRGDDIARVLGFFVERARPVVFLQSLENLGRITRTTVTIDVDDDGVAAGYMGFRVIVEGEGRDTARYLRLLEHLPYVMTIAEISDEKALSDGSAQTGPPDRLAVRLRVRAR